MYHIFKHSPLFFMHDRKDIGEDSLVAPFMGDDGGDEERFDSVVDTGRWRPLKVLSRSACVSSNLICSNLTRAIFYLNRFICTTRLYFIILYWQSHAALLWLTIHIFC